LELDALGARRRNLLGGRAMNLPSIPDDDQGATQLPAKLLDERDRRCRANVFFVDERQADLPARRGERHGADDAQTVVAVPRSLNGRAAAGGPSPAVDRLEPKARFVDEDDAGAYSTSLFLIRGQSFFRQRSTAAASCSRATRCGFWGVKPSSCRMRPRWSAWYVTRNFLRTTSATRRQVHKSVRYPAANGPAFKRTTSWSFCSAESFGEGPGWGLAASDFTPPSSHARFQRFTLERWTPTRSAISGRGFRAWKYSAARRRRASNSVPLPLVLINHTTAIAPTMVHSPR